MFEGKLVPDLEHEDFTLFAGQAVQRGLNLMAALRGLAQLGSEESLALLEAAVGLLLADGPAGFAPGVIDRRAADGSDQQRLRVAGQLPLVPPVAHEGFLHHILGIGERAGPLTGTEQQLGAVGLEPVFPSVLCMRCLHEIRWAMFPEERHGRRGLSILHRRARIQT